MAQTFLKLLILFVAYLSVSAEICRFSPKLHEEYFNVPADILEPQFVKSFKDALKVSLDEIQLFTIENLSTEACKKANSMMEFYGEAVMTSFYPLNIEEYERSKLLKTVTEVAFRKIVYPGAVFPDIMDSPIMDKFYHYYHSLAHIRNSFMRIFKTESDEILQLIGKDQDVLNRIEACFFNDDSFINDNIIISLLGTEELASKVIAIKNTMKQKFDQRFITGGCEHYDTILESAFDELNDPSEYSMGFSQNLVNYQIFKRLQELNCDESFNFLLANYPLAKVTNFKENLDLPAILNICIEYSISRAKRLAPSELKDDEKPFKDFENLAIPLVNQNVSILSKLPTKLVKPEQSDPLDKQKQAENPDQLDKPKQPEHSDQLEQSNQLDKPKQLDQPEHSDQPVKPELLDQLDKPEQSVKPEQPDPTKKQTQDSSPQNPSTPSPTIDKFTIFLYTSPIWLLIIGVIIFLVHKQLQKRK
jgi:hypothetical protein